ncbi:MAG TPA: hypothetical protein VK763_04990 [Terriglobales bacterium]|nr:hypothetical protein [Terriglobales bacterium]
MSKKAFDFEFDDQSASATGKKHDALSYEVLEEAQLRAELLDGILFLSGNRPGFLSLARILVKIGLSGYKDGFHIHLRRDFSGDADLPDQLTICLNSK